MFDHLEWWQVLLVLAPVVGIMHLIRWREAVASSTAYRDLNLKQKAYVLLGLLPPAASAELWMEVGEEDRKEFLEEASALRGNGRNLHDPLIKEFLKALPKGLKDGEAADPHERLCNAFRTDNALARRVFLEVYGSALGRGSAS